MDTSVIGKGWENDIKIIKTQFKKVENSEVLETLKYNLFKFDVKNRPVTEEKVNFFVKQFRSGKFYMVEFPIIVDSNLLIIDGQHRFEAAKTLGMPIYFRYANTLTMDSVTDVQINSGWSTNDYIHAFIKQKNQNYVILYRFIQRYKISATVAVSILSQVQHGGMNRAGFYEGTFKVVDEEKSHKQANAINKIGEAAFGLNKHRAFCMAVVSIINHPDYEEKRMLSQLGKYSSLMKRHMTVENYIRNLEEVYNYKLFNKNRVRFI